MEDGAGSSTKVAEIVLATGWELVSLFFII